MGFLHLKTPIRGQHEHLYQLYLCFITHFSDSPKHTTVSVNPSGPVPEGRSVSLTCSSTANPAVRSYTWYRADGGQETFIGAGAVLNFKVSKEDSSFFCKAENDIGVGQSNLSQIDVQCMYEISQLYVLYTLIVLS